jgi:predicted sulfurtransferase
MAAVKRFGKRPFRTLMIRLRSTIVQCGFQATVSQDRVIGASIRWKNCQFPG